MPDPIPEPVPAPLPPVPEQTTSVPIVKAGEEKERKRLEDLEREKKELQTKNSVLERERDQSREYAKTLEGSMEKIRKVPSMRDLLNDIVP